MAGADVGIKNPSDVTVTPPAGEISALLGPSGTGKSVLRKSIIGLLEPEKGSIFIHDADLVRCSESKLFAPPRGRFLELLHRAAART